MTLMMSPDKVSSVTKAVWCWVCQGWTHVIPLQGISAFPDGDNLLSWIGTVEGPKESVYEGLTYKLRLEFPAGRRPSPAVQWQEIDQHLFRLSLPVSNSQVLHPLLPSQRGQPRQHLPRHPQREMVCFVWGQYFLHRVFHDVLVKGLIARVSERFAKWSK